MGKQKQKKKTTSMFTGFNYNTAVKESQKKAAAAKKIADAKKLTDKKASDNKKAKEDANKLTRTYGGTSAVSGKTETKVESKAKSNFNYNTELAKKQMLDKEMRYRNSDKKTTDKKTTDKKTTDKKGTGTIKAKTVIDKNGKTVYSKDGSKTVLNNKGKTVYSKDGSKSIYNSKGKTTYSKDGSKTVLNKSGKTVYNKDGSKTTSNKNGVKTYTAAEVAASKKLFDAKTAALKKAADKTAADKKKAADPKTKNGKEVKTVVESLIRPKTPVSSNSGGKGGGTGTGGKGGGTGTPVVVKTPAKTVSQIWKEKTGTEWSEAKKQGLSDGSAKSNLALLEKLKSGSLDKDKQSPAKMETVPAKMETVKATDMKISYNGPTKLAGVGNEPIDNELIDKPGYGAKKKLGGIMRKGGQVRKKRKK